MFCLRNQLDLPNPERFRRGSVTLLLVIAMICVLLAVPVGTACIRRAHQWLLIRRSHQYVCQVLPAACTGLNLNELSAGRAKINTISARSMLAQHFQDHCPSILADCLELKQIRFTVRLLPDDPDHWMGDRQPDRQPIVTLEAILHLPDETPVPIVHTLEIFVD